MLFELEFIGENYEKYSHLHGIKLLNVIRRQIKETFPEFKFKIRRNQIDSFRFYVIAGPIDLLTPEAIAKNNGYSKQVDSCWMYAPTYGEAMFTNEGRLILSNIYNLIKSFTFSNSNIRTGYLHTNFYFYVAVGYLDIKYKKIDKKK
jgi:hypothetical protein